MSDQTPTPKLMLHKSVVVARYFFSLLLVITGAVFFYEEFDRGLAVSKWIGLPLTDEMKRFEWSVSLAGWIWKIALLIALFVLPGVEKAKTGIAAPPAIVKYAFDQSRALPPWLAYGVQFLLILAGTFVLVIAMFTFRDSPIVQNCHAEVGMVLDHFFQWR